MMDTIEAKELNSDPLFDDSAKDFAGSTDVLIAQGLYKRGELFVNAVKDAVPGGAELLDYGCGPGRISRLLALEGYRLHGLDPSAGMLWQARHQDIDHLEIVFDQVNDNGESLQSARYDGIVCSSTIEYVRDAAALLNHFHRSLRDNGTLIISYANRRSLWRKYSELRFPQAGHLRLQHHIWSFGECKSFLARSGFEVISGPVFAEAAPFDKRPWLRPLSSWSMIGVLGLVVARRLP